MSGWILFLERELPTTTGTEHLLSDKQSAIRPRVLTVERRNPTAIQLRVLQRLTWTESDPYYQYEKLKAAYELANWSEDFFNNRALFSDYYLKERLREFPVWKDDPKPAYLKLREVYQRAAFRFAGKEREALYRDLVRPVLDILGFAPPAKKGAQSAPQEPHHKLYSTQSYDSVLALCQVYPWDRSLDGKDDRRDFLREFPYPRDRLERQNRIKKKGQVYLENDKHERKATGSYYTPDHIVTYIVEHAVGPILKEKFDAMRPRLRDAQQKRRAFFDKQEALRKQGLRTEPESKAEFIGQELVDNLFDIKVLDMAMGSGHFLVEAVDYITDKMLDFLNGFPWNPVIAHLSHMRETILQEMEDQKITIGPKRLTDVNLLKRHVLKRCIYGVDINPMAVELAKVSLWLDCFTLGARCRFSTTISAAAIQ